LIALSVGWGTKFVFLLDSDDAGEKERRRYAVDQGAPIAALLLLSDLVDGGKEIESLLDDIALGKIKTELGLTRRPNKKQIQRFFQEKLAQREYVPLSATFTKRGKKLLSGLSSALARLDR
jgi:hypothetical protein